MLPNGDGFCCVVEEANRLPVVFAVVVEVKGAPIDEDVGAAPTPPPKRPPDNGVAVLLLEPPNKVFVCCVAGCD